MKVIEFKLSPHPQAIESWEYQLNAYKAVWNSALALKIEAENRYWINRLGLKEVCSSARYKIKGNKVINKKVTQWRTVLCGVVRPDSDKPILERGEVVGFIRGPYCCVRKLQGVEPLEKTIDIDGQKITAALSKTKSFANYEWLNTSICDSRYLTGVYKTLTDAWKAYTDKIRKRPKFKGKKDKLKSLTNGSGLKASSFVQIGNGPNGYVKFPKMKPVYCKGLFKRYRPNEMKIGTVKVVKKSDEWYLQLTHKNPPAQQIQPSDKAVGIDPGVKKNLTLSNGSTFVCKSDDRIQERIIKLQKKASRQFRMSGNSNNHKRTQTKIARLKSKQARSRNAWQHKSTSRIRAEFGVIAIEDTNLKNMTRKPKAKKNESGGYAPNGAKAKAGLNKAILKSGIGGVKAKLAAKCESSGRIFVKVPPHYTSATCNACGHKHMKHDKKMYRPTQSQFICQSCGHTANADINAAKNILDDGLSILSAQ